MAKREVVYYGGRYKGTLLLEKECDKLNMLRKLSNNKGVVEDLKNTIVDLSPSDVSTILETKDNGLVTLKLGELTDAQTVGVAFMYFAKRVILGDSVGLGKTVEVCSLCNLLRSQAQKNGLEFRFLLLTEKALLTETQKKMIKFTGEYTECLYGEKDKIKKFEKDNVGCIPPSVVGSHSLLTSVYFQDYIRGFMEEYGYNPFDILIIDEAGTILTNSATKTYKSALYFEDIFERIIMLNATSFEKELENFYNQLNFLDSTLLPTKTDFDRKYKEYTYGYMPYPVFEGKYKNGEDFKKLVGYRYFQRTRKSLGRVMEDCDAKVYVSDLSAVQKELINKVSIPRMVYDCPSYFNNLIDVETNMETTPKLKDLVDIIESIPEGEPILVYAIYKEAQRCIHELLTEGGLKCEIMNGGTDAKTRDALITRFKLGDLDVLVTNVQKGLDFGNCNHCVFYDYDSNPNKMVQVEGRMTREMDIIGKTVYLIMSRGAELKSFKSMVADRAQASDLFAGSDYSCVLSLLLNKELMNDLV